MLFLCSCWLHDVLALSGLRPSFEPPALLPRRRCQLTSASQLSRRCLTPGNGDRLYSFVYFLGNVSCRRQSLRMSIGFVRRRASQLLLSDMRRLAAQNDSVIDHLYMR